MQVQYFIEYVLHCTPKTSEYDVTSAAWAQGLGHGLCLTARYLPGNKAARDIADWRMNALVEDGVQSLTET